MVFTCLNTTPRKKEMIKLYTLPKKVRPPKSTVDVNMKCNEVKQSWSREPKSHEEQLSKESLSIKRIWPNKTLSSTSGLGKPHDASLTEAPNPQGLILLHISSLCLSSAEFFFVLSYSCPTFSGGQTLLPPALCQRRTTTHFYSH